LAGAETETHPSLLQIGDFQVDPATLEVRRDDRVSRLEPKVMDVLLLLANRPGEVVTRADFEREVWKDRVVGYDALANAISKLRREFSDNGRQRRYIETVSKTGYRLVASVDRADGVQIPSRVDEPNSVSAPSAAGQPSHAFVVRPGLIAGGLLLLLVCLAVLWQWLPREAEALGGELPVIAVLPFENLAAESDQDYFADGVTEDLITDLSRLSGLQVLARQSVQPYLGSTKTESDIGRELGASFLVRGTVRRDGNRLRVNVRLIDVAGGINRWAERYDRNLADIFEVQDNITWRVVSALQVQLVPGERAALTKQHVASVEAYDQYLRGLDLLGRRSGSDNTDAKQHFEQAIELDPGFALAYAGLSQAYTLDAVYERGPGVVESLDRAATLARQAQIIDNNLPQVAYVLGFVEMLKGNLADAVVEISRAIQLRPSYADAHALLARTLHFAGRPDDGMRAMERAIELNPQVPGLYRMVRGALLYQEENYEQAVDQLRASVDVSPSLLLSRIYLAAAYAADNQLEEANWEIEEILQLAPDFTLNSLEYGFPYRDPRFRDRFLSDLRSAGLRE
jgi:TolB-like protein/DNA-binding winged helix-turn-helix (wHTH) protein/Flp pilus assembly protein TadD